VEKEKFAMDEQKYAPQTLTKSRAEEGHAAEVRERDRGERRRKSPHNRTKNLGV
jgi:hypothetical protein